jgi:transposase
MRRKKKDTRNLSEDAQEALRLRAVKAVLTGKTQREVARAFGVTECIVSIWMKIYATQGLEGLRKKKRGPKVSRSALKGWQAAAICKIIRDRHPEQMKLPFALWTSRSIRDLVRRKFGIVLARRTIRRYLQRWGYTPQKPKRIAYEKNDAAVRKWKNKQYPAIRELAKKERARIYWADEMGIRSDHQAGRSYSPKGVTPTRLGTGKRFSCNMISGITNRGDLSFMVFKGRFVNKVFIAFMERLLKEAKGRKVFLIVDGHPVHKSVAVRKWVEEHSKHIRLYFLPSYSPELNPDECVNNDVKANAVGTQVIKNRRAMIRKVREYLKKRKKDPEQVKRYFNDPDVRYAA